MDDLDKEIIILRYYQELRIKDISQIIDIPASTVRYKLKNAEKALKNRLEL
ncbi:MAG: RNA polymerase sigma factor [Lacrimispora saccharolytica]